MKAAEKSRKAKQTTLRDYIWALKGIRIPVPQLVMILLTSLGSTFAGLRVSFFTGDMVDAGGNVPTEELIRFVGFYVSLGVCAALGYFFSSWASERINIGLRSKLWKKIIFTRQSSYDSDGGESLVSRVTSDCDFASKLLTTAVNMISIAVSMGIYVSRMYSLSVRISNAMLLLIPVSALCGWLYAWLKYRIARKTQAMLSRTTTYLVERTGNIPLIKTANAQQEENALGQKHFDEQYRMQIKNGLMDVFFTALQTVFNILSLLIPFLIGGSLVRARVMRVGSVIAFYSIAGTVGAEATNLINSVGTIRQANGALSRVINTLRLPDEQTQQSLRPVKQVQEITLSDVSFAYDEKNVLSNIHCTIPPHQVTAVIGANGSGKSTLFKLLDRLYDPTSGTLQLGSEPAEAYDLRSWRKVFCLVEQGSPMMEGTIRENICYGCEEPVTEERLVEVAKKARIYDFVSSLPGGFDAPVAAGGTNFSGGQRQCLAIARAMMNDPQCLLLDEATSSLDASSERSVLEALEELMRDRTTVVIAHSLAAIRNADHVIVLREGKVESSGSPAMILKQANNYLGKVMSRRA